MLSLARWRTDHRRIVLALWVVTFVVVLGERTRRFPRRLDRRLPRLALEREGPVPTHARPAGETA